MPEAESLKEHLLLTLRPPRGRKLWHGGPMPEGALRGVGPAAAAWRPAPKRHSIWELTLHIAYWRYAVRRIIVDDPPARFERSPSDWPLPPETAGSAEWKADIALLKREGDLFVAALEALPAARLFDRAPGSKQYTLLEKVQGVILHDHYHTAQIQMLKRLRS